MPSSPLEVLNLFEIRSLFIFDEIYVFMCACLFYVIEGCSD